MLELTRACDYICAHMHEFKAPFLVLHGTDDVVTGPEGSKALYEKASSEDKTLKLYEGAYHSLIQGEPDETRNQVLHDVQTWLDERVQKKMGVWTSFHPSKSANRKSPTANSDILNLENLEEGVQFDMIYIHVSIFAYGGWGNKILLTLQYPGAKNRIVRKLILLHSHGPIWLESQVLGQMTIGNKILSVALGYLLQLVHIE